MVNFYASTFGVVRDKKRRQNFKRHESFMLALKCLKDCNFTKNLKSICPTVVNSRTRVRNRCLLTGRSSSVLSRFRLSRIMFREKALLGFFPGVRKAV
jgi:small subunit ribosomal protein S14